MKLSASTLKNIDYKQFFIDHGEKVGMGVIALLLGLALLGTAWTPYPKTPVEMHDEATQALEEIKQQSWPDKDKKQLAGDFDLSGKVSQLLTPIDAAPFALRSFNEPLHHDKLRIRSPRWLPVMDLIANADFANLSMDPSVPPVEENFVRKPKEKDDKKDATGKKKRGEKKPPAKKGKDKKSDEDSVPEEFQTNRSLTGDGGGVPGMGFSAGALRRAWKRKEKMGDRGMGDDANGGGELGGATPVVKKPKLNSRGFRFVSVRGVYPLREQVTELIHALGDPGFDRKQAQDMIRLREDFKLERQTEKPGPNPWSGPWEPVDKEPVVELLKNEITGYAPEVVADGIIDTTICMPFPQRLVGSWGQMATHPKIKNFVLSDEEIEEQVKFERKLIDRMQNQKEEEDKKSGRKKGWAAFTNNFRTMQQRATDASSVSVRDQILNEIENKGANNVDKEKIDEKLTEFVKKHATPTDHLLLFRYLDFAVEPGKTYRYHVKLSVENPFREKEPSEVADPSIIEGESRDTEFSEPTPPVHVPEDARFFVAHVDSRVGGNSIPGVIMDFYQWFVSTGTVVNHRNLEARVGQLLGGRYPAQVLRPAEETFDSEKVPFSTKDALVDVTSGFSLSPDAGLHKDILDALNTAKDNKHPTTPVPDEALVVDDSGGLTVIDGMDQAADHAQTRQKYEWQNKPFESLVKKDKDDSDNGGRLDLRGGGSPLKGKGGDPRRRAAKSKN